MSDDEGAVVDDGVDEGLEDSSDGPPPPIAEVQTSTENGGDGGEPERKMMEEELLQDMIRDRETSNKMIRKKLEQQSEKMEKTKASLQDLKKSLKAENAEQQMEIETYSQRYSKLLSQYREAKDGLDMKKQQQGGAQLHLYNEVMKAVAAPESRDSSYVMRMQAQLCKAMHSMGMVETQFAMASNNADALQKHLKEIITNTVEEKSQVELKLMNDLMLEDGVRRDLDSKHKEMMDQYTTERDNLLERIERQEEEPPEEDDDEEKEELQEILSQGREEIERMETENQQELERLETIKAKAIEIKGVDYVEEICNAIVEEWKEKERLRKLEEEEESSEEEDSD